MLVIGRGGTVDGRIFFDLLLVAFLLVRPNALRSGRRIPARMGCHPFERETLTFHSLTAPGRRGYFHFFFIKHDRRGRHGALFTPPAVDLIAEDSADHPVTGVDRFSSRGL